MPRSSRHQEAKQLMPRSYRRLKGVHVPLELLQPQATDTDVSLMIDTQKTCDMQSPVDRH